MTNDSPRQGTSHNQTADRIRDVTFQRRMRGLDADKVYGYLDMLADQLQTAERELSKTRAENESLRAELRRVQTELDSYEQVGDRVNEQAVQLFSQAQLVAEQMVQDVSRDARERIGQARVQERKIVEEAMDNAGHHIRSYAQTAQAQMQSIMDSFATEVDRLGSPGAPGRSGPPGPGQNDPLFDHSSDWQRRSRNGSGPDSAGSV